MREHLESYQKQTRKPHPMLANAPALPRGLEPLWRDFLSLHDRRGSTGMGPAPIRHTDLDAFQRVHDVRFDAWEIECIERADNAYFAARASA